MLFVFMLCLGLLTQFVYFKYDFPSCAVLLICFFFPPNSISTPFLYEGAMCSGEIALKNNHYYYYYSHSSCDIIGTNFGPVTFNLILLFNLKSDGLSELSHFCINFYQIVEIPDQRFLT